MRVLLIEDDSAMARSIELMLRSEGLNVYTTDLGEKGRKAIAILFEKAKAGGLLKKEMDVPVFY